MKKLAEAVAAMKESEYLMNSLVAYMVDLLEQYASGVLSHSHMASEFVRRLNMTKFYFIQMPKKLAVENLQVFSNELSLANRLNEIALQANLLEEDAFTQKLLECIEDYTATYTIRKPAP